MGDEFVINKSCGECSKSGTRLCYRADHCVQHGYKDFSNKATDPFKYCCECWDNRRTVSRLRRMRNRRPRGDQALVNTELLCPICGQCYI